MKFEQSKYFDTLNASKHTLPIGDFYFCEKICVAEINEGIHLDSETVLSLIKELIAFYGYNKKLGFVSNRINSYSIDPNLYVELSQEFNLIVVSALVVYNPMSFMNAGIEERFSTIKLNRFVELDQSIEWVLNNEELT